MVKLKNIPELRFPGFEGEWERSKLGILTNIKSGLSIDQNNDRLGYPVTRIETIADGSISLQKVGYVETKKNIADYKLVQGDILFSNINSVFQIGKTAYVSNNLNLYHGMNLLLIRQKKELIPFYLYLFLNTYKTKRYFKSICNRAVNQASINQTELSKTKISLPSLPEQQKIATFLSAVDQRLSHLKKKQNLLEQYKKGVMQQIFSQKIRFKDDNGQEFPEWEKKRLGDISNRITNKNKGGNQNILTISAQQGLVSQFDFFNKTVAAKDLTGYYLLKKDDFAYNKSYSTGYPMGAIKRLKLYDLGVVSSLYICFESNKSASISFMEQYFESGIHNREIEKIAQEGARNHGLLNVGIFDFFNTEINLPSLPEQTKIANYLSAIDDKIQHTKQQIERTQLWKKGLMQKMFV